MAFSETSVAEQKPVTDRSEHTGVNAAIAPTQAPALGPDSPGAYKIVRVKKPDGTIVRVRRPINNIGISLEKPIAVVDKDPALPAKTKTAQTTKPTVTAVDTPAQVHKPSEEIVSGKQPINDKSNKQSTETAPARSTSNAAPVATSKDVLGSASSPVQRITSKPAPKPTPLQTKPPPALNPAATGYRLFRTFHRLHKHVAQGIATFDPDVDVGDMEDGDVETDNDDENTDDDDDDDDDDDNTDNDDNDGVADDDENTSDQDRDEHPDPDTNSINANPTTTHNGAHDGDIEKEALHMMSRSIPRQMATSTATPGSEQRGAATNRAKSGMEYHERQLNETDPPASKACSARPRTLKGKPFSFSKLIVLSIMLLFPLLFIVLGILTAVINGSSSDSALGAGVHQAITIAVTAWPIMFAAIIAQSLKSLATFRVERGIRLMALEQLINSHSVASAVKQPFSLQRFDWLTVALLCLWSLSPLASQALQRMSYIGPNGSTSSMNIYYLTTEQPPLGFDNTFIPTIDVLYGASIISPFKAERAPTDLWNAPKIPILETLNTTDGNGWYIVNPIPSNPSNIPYYSSLMGVPMTGPTDGLNMTFTIQSSYFLLNCPSLETATLAQINQTSSVPMVASRQATLWMGITNQGVATQGNSSSPTQGLWTVASMQTDNNTLYDYTICSFAKSYVESHISCSGEDCAVDKMRPWQNNNASTIALSDLQAFVSGFVNAGSSTAATIRTPTEEYLLGGPQLTGANSGSAMVSGSLSSANPTWLKQSLGIVFNTYWQAGIAPFDQTGTLSTASGNVQLSTSIAAVENINPAYQTSWAWLSVLFVCGLVLLIAAIACIVLDRLVIAPDILGFASSIVRKSKHVKLENVDSAMSGPERARQLADLKVMMQDVNPKAEIGKIALGTVSDKAQRLEKGRLYL